MPKERINIGKIVEYIKQQRISSDELNRLFYYSLFDSTSFETQDPFFPASLINDYQDKTRALLKNIFTNKRKYPEMYKFIQSYKFFPTFETHIISSDILSRVLLSKKLESLGIKSAVMKVHPFDLEIKYKKIKIELKRIWSWTNYCEYLKSFQKKIKGKAGKFIYVVAHSHPFTIENMLSGLEEKTLFDKYISNIARSHYATERLIKKNRVKVCIGHITKDGRNGQHIQSLCEEIKEKIKEFSE